MIIGYTTGVFDLFHIGHLNILKRAKEKCDFLIVGVSTDELVETYKHRKPVIPFEERVAIVEAIKYVDKVVPQTSMDKMAAWNKMHFDVVFHGNDWQNSSLYTEYEKQFADIGVSLVYFEYTEGVSSTMLRERLNKEK